MLYLASRRQRALQADCRSYSNAEISMLGSESQLSRTWLVIYAVKWLQDQVACMGEPDGGAKMGVIITEVCLLALECFGPRWHWQRD